MNRDAVAGLQGWPDFGFAAAQPEAGWLIGQGPGGEPAQQVISQAARQSGTLRVMSIDYGGWALPTAQLFSGPLINKYARDKRGPATTAEGTVVFYAGLPYDLDVDHIADGFDRNVGQNGFNGPKLGRDPEALISTPLNAALIGDGFSDYEEYRGLYIGAAWRAMNKDAAEVFVQLGGTHPSNAIDLANYGTAGFDQTNLTIILVGAGDHQGGVMNWSSPAATRLENQKVLRIINAHEKLDALGNPILGLFGETPGGPNIPAQTGVCNIYVGTIATWSDDLMGFTPAEKILIRDWEIRHIISHELAHGVNVRHHQPETADPRSCYMRYVTLDSINNLNHIEYSNAVGQNWVRRELKLRSVP